MTLDGRKVRWDRYKRQIEETIYYLLDENITRKEICEKLDICPATLYKHLRIMRNKGILDENFNKTSNNPYSL